MVSIIGTILAEFRLSERTASLSAIGLSRVFLSSIIPERVTIDKGSQPTFFNTPDAEENALTFASATDAVTLKARARDCPRTAVDTRDPEHR
jgi:hypothetical protein